MGFRAAAKFTLWAVSFAALLGQGPASAAPMVSKEGRFQADFPVAPTDSSQMVETASGPILVHVTMSETASRAFFFITYGDRPPGGLNLDSDFAFHWGCQDMAAN